MCKDVNCQIEEHKSNLCVMYDDVVAALLRVVNPFKKHTGSPFPEYVFTDPMILCENKTERYTMLKKTDLFCWFIPAADREEHQNVAVRAAARPQAAEERPAGMPRRRRNLHSRVNVQRAQRPSDNEDSPAEADEDQEDRQPSEERPQAAAKVGAKKQKKLEEKQARKAQREAELEEREERRKMQELRDQERQKEEEKERLQEQKREEELRRSKEEQERKEEQEYRRSRSGRCFVIEDQGEAEELSEQELRLLYFLCITSHLMLMCFSVSQPAAGVHPKSKVVLLEDLASHFSLRTQDAIGRLQDLIADGSLTGVIDVRGKFIFITPEELNAVAHFIKQRGKVSISELVQASNTLINLTPELPSSA
ncbi:DDRGK domain-containing protein 1 [Cyprinus carpio]|uniref:DDRGK domain-containing protein 1 n=1 Tax=Cyprinus carpio TaxID=7962 RepID=A0A9Q9Y3V5_CYPCA|nr:DDRGK domain-containing protein 1 [Cyprinus carpio]